MRHSEPPSASGLLSAPETVMWDILENAQHEVLLAVWSRPSPPENARLVLSAAADIAFERNSKDHVILADVPAELRQAMARWSKVLVTENDGIRQVREYWAAVVSA